ncbi:MAG: PaaI family thioesterase [Rhizobiaceae bacterium]
MQYKPVMNAEEVTRYVRKVFPQADSYGWRAREVEPGAITVDMKVSGSDLRPGGTVSGPTMFALADVTAYLLVLAHIGEVALAVTTSLNINFLNKPDPGDLVATGRFLKLGKRLAICDIHIESTVTGTLVAQATATYSIPPA